MSTHSSGENLAEVMVEEMMVRKFPTLAKKEIKTDKEVI
jgi:hypothetical protein